MRVVGVETVEVDGADDRAGADGTGIGSTAMLLDLEMSQRYRHPLGSASPFFVGLAGGVLLATACDRCGRTSFPPRQICDRELSPTRWYQLPGTGTVVAATVVHSPPPFGGIDAPYVLASIALDGVDGGLTHRILGDSAPPAGSLVSVRFIDGPTAHPLLAIAFAVDHPQETP